MNEALVLGLVTIISAASSALVSSKEASEGLLAKMSEGGGIFGELGREMSGTSSEQGEEISAAASGPSGRSGTSSGDDLSLKCSPTDIK